MVKKTENECECICHKTCPTCGCIKKQLSIFGITFFDLWLQKIFRNVASMKFQWLMLLYVPIIWGMFNLIPGIETPTPWVSAEVGLGFIGGGFVVLATSRIVARTKLTNGTNGDLDTDK